MENKNSYFFIKAVANKKHQSNDFFNEQVRNSLDIILGSMNATKENYIFKDKDSFLCFFKTVNRKRNGQLNKFAERHFSNLELEFSTQGLKKIDYDEGILKCKRKEFKILEEPESLVSYLNYNGNDLKIFKEKADWHPWQREIYNQLFDDKDYIREADDRAIVSIVDMKGNSGKSSFFKWIFLKYPKQIGRISYGSACQLRSILTKNNAKKIYIIDLPRSKGKNDNELDLLSTIEDLKTGFVINNMYGDGATLIMEPPHVIVSSNYILDREALSQDRWVNYKITKEKGLKRLSEREINSIESQSSKLLNVKKK